MTDQLAYDADALAKALCCSLDTLNARVLDGTLPKPRTFGGKRVWTADDMRAALKNLPEWGSEAVKVDDKVKVGAWQKSTSPMASASGKTGKAGRSATTTATAGRKKAARGNV